MKKFFSITLPAAALCLTALVTTAPSAQAREYCRNDFPSGRLDCSYDNVEQCRASASGRGGDCFRDPALNSAANANANASAPRALTLSARKQTKH